VVEKMLGKRRTDELAVMCDPFRPLRLTQLAHDLDDPSYALSWHTPLEAATA
jgi:homogentisate 1,2-dioxygenase